VPHKIVSTAQGLRSRRATRFLDRPHEHLPSFGVVTAGRSLRRQSGRASAALVGIWSDASPRAGRSRVVHRIVGCWPCRVRAIDARVPRVLVRLDEEFFSERRAGDQGHRAHHEPRRQSRRILAEVALRWPRRTARRAGIFALRMYQRGHQQYEPRPDAEGGTRASAASRAGPDRCQTHLDGASARRCGDAQPHPRPNRIAHDTGQGASRARGLPTCDCSRR
jgi:hypothetical protein